MVDPPFRREDLLQGYTLTQSRAKVRFCQKSLKPMHLLGLVCFPFWGEATGRAGNALQMFVSCLKAHSHPRPTHRRRHLHLFVFKIISTLKKFLGKTTPSLCVCVFHVPRKRLLGKYWCHHHQAWHSNCLRHGDASRANYIDLDLHSRSQGS